eukprot:7488038-Pyramimonas_sp.AAC.1
MHCEGKPMSGAAMTTICYLASEAGAKGDLRHWGVAPSDSPSGIGSKKMRSNIRELAAADRVEPSTLMLPGYNSKSKRHELVALRVRPPHESLSSELFATTSSFEDLRATNFHRVT